MDKKTLSHYGWMIIVTLILAVMLAFASPFGTYIGDGVISISQGFVSTQNHSVNEDTVQENIDKYEGLLNDCTHEDTQIVLQKDATCEKDGYTGDKVCKDCHATIEQGQVIEKGAHVWSNETIIKAANCKETGISQKVCSVCNKSVETEIPKTDHGNFYTKSGKPVTCTMDGETDTVYCGFCNQKVQVGQQVLATGHKKVNGGTKDIHTKCSECGAVLSSSHKYTKTTLIAPTCSVKGKWKFTCDCGYSYEEEDTKQPEHTIVNIPAVPSTCTSTGFTEKSYCSVCNKVFTERKVTPKLEHKLNEVYLNADYVSHYKCSNCGIMIMPEGSVYYVQTTYPTTGDYSGAKQVIMGDGKTTEFPKTSSVNDVYKYKDYEYYYGCGYCRCGVWSNSCGHNYNVAGWGARCINDKTAPCDILNAINNESVKATTFTFFDLDNVQIVPLIPDSVNMVEGMFELCINLQSYKGSGASNGDFSDYIISDTITSLNSMFANCKKINCPPNIPTNIETMDYAFLGCENLYITNNLIIPNTIKSMEGTFSHTPTCASPDISGCNYLTNISHCFSGCNNLMYLSELPENIIDMSYTFYNCTDIYGFNFEIPSSVEDMSYAFYNCNSMCSFDGRIPESVKEMDYTFAYTALSYDYCHGVSIYIDANPTKYDNCFIGAKNIAYIQGESDILVELATTDGYTDFSNNDKIRVAVKNPIPSNATYIKSNGTKEFGDDVTLTGDGVNVSFPDAPLKYDIYEQGEYRYTYKCFYDRYRIASELASEDEPELFRYDSNYGKYYHLNDDLYNTCDHNPKQENCAGWGMDLQWCMHHKDSSRTNITEVALSDINGIPVNNARCAFHTFENLTVTPELPESLQCLQDTFAGCSSLTSIEKIPSNAVVIAGMFANCSSLNTSPELPSTVIDIHNTFRNCVSLVTAPTIPEGVHVVYSAFLGCTALTGPVEINMEESLNTCYWDDNMLDYIFYSTTQPIYVWGTSPCLYDIVYNTSHNGNVHLLEMGGTIPTGGTYYVGVTGTAHGDFSGATATYTAGQTFPTPKVNDVFVYDGYEYRYGKYYSGDAEGYKNSADEWFVKTLENDTNRSKTSFDDAPVLRTISGKRIQSMQYTYLRMYSFNDSTVYIPDTVLYMVGTFEKCTSLVNANDIKIPNGVRFTSSMFLGCNSLCYADIEIPNTVTHTDLMFYNCPSLTTGPSVIPNSCYILDAMFHNCTALTGDIEINCTKSPLLYPGMFEGTIQPIFIYGPCDYNILESIAATSTNNNVQVLTSKIIETSHNPYENNNNYIVLGTYNFPNANSVNITITYQTESTSYDWISITEGKNYVAGKSYTEQRKYLTSSGSITTTKGNSSTAKIGGTTYTTKTFNNVNLKTGSIIFRTDGSVNSYYGAKVIITPNY